LLTLIVFAPATTRCCVRAVKLFSQAGWCQGFPLPKNTPKNSLIFQLLISCSSGYFGQAGVPFAIRADFSRNTISGMNEFTIKHAESAREIARTREKWPRHASELVATGTGQTPRITEVLHP
jgi:hypothetical protein